MDHRKNYPAFTLIEVLVVVAIIALLVAILLPSLARARAQARMLTCGTNVRQIVVGFATYTVENKGRFPGSRGDTHGDWLGGSNPNAGGRQPDGGTIWKYMGRDKLVYMCPEDNGKGTTGSWYWSYTANLLLSGAKGEMLSNAHYPTNAYDRKDHTADMKPFNGVPLVIEEDRDFGLTTYKDSGWCNQDCFSDRHMQGGGDKGRGNVAFADAHVGQVRLPPNKLNGGMAASLYFEANDMCIRTKGGKWVSGRTWISAGMYGIMDHAPSASDPDKSAASPVDSPGGGGITHN